MVLRKDSTKPKKNSLESLSLSELVETITNEVITYRNILSKVSEKEIDFVTDEYTRRTKPLKEELNKRENLYLLYHQTYISG